MEDTADLLRQPESTTERLIRYSTPKAERSYENRFSTNSLLHLDLDELLDAIPSRSTVTSTLTDRRLNRSRGASSLPRTPSPEKLLSPMQVYPETRPVLDVTELLVQVSTFLSRNGLSMDFLGVIRVYVRCLVENGIDPSQDQHLVQLNNELRLPRAIESKVLLHILETFLHSPEGLLMRYASFQYLKEKVLLEKMFKGWYVCSLINNRLSELAQVWKQYEKKKVLDNWRNKAMFVKHELKDQALQFDHLRLLSAGLHRMLDKHDTNNVSRRMADTFYLNRFYGKWVDQKHRNSDLGKRAEVVYKKNLTKNALKVWFLSTREKTRSVELQQRRIMKSALVKMKMKMQKIHVMNEEAHFLELKLSVGGIFTMWHELTLEDNGMMVRLNKTANKFVYAKFVELWINRFNESRSLVRAQSVSDQTLLRFIWNSWKKRLVEQHALQQQVIEREQRLMRQMFDSWKLRLYAGIKAEQHYESVALKRYFKSWQLKYRERFVNARTSTHYLGDVFERWKKATILRQRYRQFTTKHVLQPVWSNYFESSLVTVNDMYYRATVFSNRRIKHHVLCKWIAKWKSLETLNQKADLFTKIKVVTRLTEKYDRISTLYHEAAIVYDTNIYNRTVRGSFYKWLDLWNQRIEQHFETRADKFRLEADLELVRVFFKHWIQKSLQYTEYQDIADRYHLRVLGVEFFNHVFRRMNEHDDMLAKAEMMDQFNLEGRTFDIWLNKLNKIGTMEQVLEDFKADQDLKMGVRILNKWSMMFMKQRRDNENVAMFRRRWDRASLRAILILWKERAKLEPRSRSSYADDTLVITPTKNRTSNTIIPGSERIQKSRLEAMKRHYGRARPSPVKETVNLPSTVRRRLDFSAQELTSRESSDELAPPKISLEKINKNFGSRRESVDFSNIPVIQHGTLSPGSISPPKRLFIDKSDLDVAFGPNFKDEESPTRR